MPDLPPKALGTPGDHEDGQTVALTVRMHLGKDGHLWSTHEAASPEDEARLRSWSGGGHRHIAHALLTEATRREAFVCLLVALTERPEFLGAFANRERLIESLMGPVTGSLTEGIRQMAKPSIEEAVAMVRGQEQASTG